MTIPTPHELGFPPKYDKWRPLQIQALEWLLTRKTRVKAVTAPTGFGKTAVYVAYALITGEPTCIVTESRALQDQLMEDFAGVGMVDVRGRSNYCCSNRPGSSCEEGYASGCPYKGTQNCESTQAENRAATSRLVVTNYAKWTSSRKFGRGMEHFKQVVFDEGHLAPDAVASAMQVVLSHHEIEEVLGEFFPPASQTDEFVNWKAWAPPMRAEAEAQTARAKALMLAHPEKPSYTKTYLHLRNLTRRLATLATANPIHWIADEHEKGYVFDPIHTGRYGEAALLLGIPSVVVISATLRPKTLYLLGIPNTGFEHIEFPSDFDPKRCPIYYVPTMAVDAKAQDFSQLWVRLDQIAAKRTDRKGIVHSVSYARQKEAQIMSRFGPKMLVNPKGEATSRIVHQFKASGPGTILVSPSVGAGFDFPGRECEWQFLLKTPFLDGRSKINRARQEADREYAAYIAINKAVQIFGRGMRFKQDQCENFIGDLHWGNWFFRAFGHLAPKWFHGFYRQVSVIPPPPPRL